MIYEVHDLCGDGKVLLHCYIHKWTTTRGQYPQRAGVLVLPGGAYVLHGASEGEPVALAFFAQGYNAYVLKYSVGEAAAFPRPVADAARALAWIRQHAETWHQDANQLAACGFSAGGHLAACLGTLWNDPEVAAMAGVATQAVETLRPNGLILGYPCIFADPEGEAEMFQLLWPSPDVPAGVARMSADLHVGPHTPPVFLWNIYADQMVPVEHGLRFQLALAKANIPFETHTYHQGVHGCALANQATSLGAEIRENAHVARWFTDCCLWLGELFGPPVLHCPQYDLYFPGQGRAQVGVPCIPEGLFEGMK